MQSRTNDKYWLSEQENIQVQIACDEYNITEPREKIWVECYTHFRSLKNERELNKDELRLSCLLLANYLAVWGMQRNSFLMYSDYHIFEEIVRIVLNKKYEILWNMTYSKLVSNKETYLKALINIRDEINNAFKKQLKRTKNISQTLITKILLGSMACCPAYDTNFCKGIPLGKDFYSNNSVLKLLNLVCDNDIFQMCAENKNLPLMKVVDMIYFKIGQKKWEHFQIFALLFFYFFKHCQCGFLTFFIYIWKEFDYFFIHFIMTWIVIKELSRCCFANFEYIK